MIMCLAKDCPEPGAVTRIISSTETKDIVQIDAGGFSILHPLRERLGNGLLDCPVNKALLAMSEPPALPGRYQARLGDDGTVDLTVMEVAVPESR
jgi:hypothetical protein